MVAGRCIATLALTLAALLVTAATGAAPRPCFGAAARDPERPCQTSRYAVTTIIPTVNEGPLEPAAPCTPTGRQGLLYPCVFGDRSGQEGHYGIALIGDSHAGHWRGAVDHVARAQEVPAVSLTRTSCPFSTAVADLPGVAADRCRRWNEEVRDWLFDHPDIDTVFVSAHAGGTVLDAGRGAQRSAQVKGYREAWAALPSTVTRLYVLRDIPRVRTGTPACLRRALLHRRPPGAACANPRGRVVRSDPQVEAARHQPRARLLDLNRYFCTAARCFPVVGHALTHKDADHMTATFAGTLGPYLLRAVGGSRQS